MSTVYYAYYPPSPNVALLVIKQENNGIPYRACVKMLVACDSKTSK